ncbi:MAG: phosphoribosylformylglycinamidine cyclo-ligase [Saprospiraceae bacterium]|nr:phosphoribosylformylglycinamidine cyclo-ligase [Saprospiraceae bacterium]
MNPNYKYNQRGVSATKDEVHQAIKKLDKGLYPNAFCKILPDLVAFDDDYCNIMHADTAGTKTSLAYLYWRETGDLSVWEGIAQDALVMNLDDMACVGCVDNIILSSTIGRNKNLISGAVIETLIQATTDFLDLMRDFDIHITLAGGETADVGDIVRTVDVGYTTFARMNRKDLIVNNIQAGDIVVGFSSFGQATYEKSYNGGMGSNGLTSARHDVFTKQYAQKYPESFDPNTPESVVYVGSKQVTDTMRINDTVIPIGKLVLSPTRTYLPVLKRVLAHFRHAIHGIIHCSGGGQTKVAKFIEGVEVIKDNFFPITPLFDLIQQEAKTDWREMYQVFNMGHRLEIYVPEQYADEIIDIARSFQVEAQIIGHVRASAKSAVQLETPYGIFRYD